MGVDFFDSGAAGKPAIESRILSYLLVGEDLLEIPRAQTFFVSGIKITFDAQIDLQALLWSRDRRLI